MNSLKGLLDEDMFAFYEAAGKYATDEGIKEYFLEMGRSEEHESKSRLVNLLLHMIKVECQPNRMSASWLNTIRNESSQLQLIIGRSPSLKPKIINSIDSLYKSACKDAEFEMRKAIHNPIPTECKWSLDDLLTRRFISEFLQNALDNNQNPMFDADKYSI